MWLRSADPDPQPGMDGAAVIDLTENTAADPSAPSTGQSAAAAAAPLLEAPATRWRELAPSALGTWLPTSPASGPADAGRLAGFAHSPEGALLAAVNLYPAIYYSRDQQWWRWLADHRVVWADGARDALWDAMEPVWDLPTDGTALRPVGFRMLSYTPELCRVRLWWSTESPGDAPVTVGAIAMVRWVDADWSLVFDEPAMDMRTLEPARDGFIAWGPGGVR